MKVEMREDKHLWITFDPAKGDPREVIIDADKDVRICDGRTVVKVRFTKDGHFIEDVLQDDIFLRQIPSLAMMYQKVERRLSLCLQPGQGHRDILREVEAARNDLRKYMRQMGWKGEF